MSDALQQQSCNSDGLCMVCKTTPPGEETLLCNTCESSWHVTCLVSRPETLASTVQWTCPDCSGDALPAGDSSARPDGGLVAAILAIETDSSLTELQKAQRRQELLSGTKVEGDHGNGGVPKDKKGVMDGLDDKLKCSICVDMLDRPVTTPCGHNFCLKCFEKSVLYARHSKRECPNCRANIPEKWASNLRINMTLVNIVRMAKMPKLNVTARPWKSDHFLHNQDRPDNAFTTERAKKSGNANAASGKIFMTIPQDHFGPITAEYDPVMNRGVLVGDTWKLRLECRQYGVHFPHVSGIAGQSMHGAQSVVLSGGYIDDEDHGEWFLYTGSGGRDLSGNKRTNNKQSFDQKFEKLNQSIRVSCLKGYPVRVVRSEKEKRSAYAPEEGLRYDGIYRVESCWRKVGTQGYKVCRYLFVRCDNEAAPWTSDAHGDRPRCLPSIPELNNATDITERRGNPSWDFDEEDGCWKWKRPPPVSKKSVDTETSCNRKRSSTRQAHNMTNKERLLKDFSCPICRQVMNLPVTTHCGHNFCKTCIEGAFSGISFVRDRSRGGRSLRSQKNVMKCPSCPTDISEFLQDPKVNRELMDVIESLKLKAEESEEDSIPVSSEEDKTDNMEVGNKKTKVQ